MVSGIGLFFLEEAMTMPSKPILISTISVTPFLAQVSISDFLMARDALLTSGCWTPTPPQNSLKPPPVPVDSTLGVLKLALALPNCSATVVVNG
jgi:hypothetical protein